MANSDSSGSGTSGKLFNLPEPAPVSSCKMDAVPQKKG